MRSAGFNLWVLALARLNSHRLPFISAQGKKPALHGAVLLWAWLGATMVAATLRFFQFLSLGCWLGSIIFFIVFTAGIFTVTPTKDLAGTIVGYSLARLHVMGIVAGCVYLLATAVLEKSVAALVRPAALLVFFMIVCTMASQYGVIARMDVLRAQMGSVDATPAGNAAVPATNVSAPARAHSATVSLLMPPSTSRR